MVLVETRGTSPVFLLRDITAECRRIDRAVAQAVKAARKVEYLENP